MFRMIILLAVVGGFAFAAGWFTIQRDENQTTIRINRDAIRSDASQAIDRGRRILNEDRAENGNDVSAEAAGSFPPNIGYQPTPNDQPTPNPPQTGPFRPAGYDVPAGNGPTNATPPGTGRQIPPWEQPRYGTPPRQQY